MGISELVQTLDLLQKAKIDIAILETCVFKNGVCQGLYWYNMSENCVCYDPKWPHVEFEDASRVGLFQTKKINERAAKNELIISHFTRDCRSPYFPVAVSLSVSPPKKSRMDNFDPTGVVDVDAEYLLKPQLEHRMRNSGDGGQSEDEIFMTKYIVPTNRCHNIVRAIYTPYVLKIEKHENIYTLDDETVPLKTRMCTTNADGKAFFTNCDVSSGLEKRVDKVCSQLFAYFKSQNCCMDSAILYFSQVGANEEIVLLWIGKLELKVWHEVEMQQILRDVPETAAGRADKLRALAKDLKDDAALTKKPRLGGAVPPPSSPCSEACYDMLHDTLVQDFGFYSGEQERIKKSYRKNIRTISHVMYPLSMVLDDTPPYDDDFIQALYDPVFGERYFYSKEIKSALSQKVSRRQSFCSRVTRAGLNKAVDSLNAALMRLPRKKSMATFSSESNSPTLGDGPNQGSQTLSPSKSMIAKPESLSYLYCDSESRNLLAESGTFLNAVAEPEEQSMVKALEEAIPDWKHSGHVQDIRRKYGYREFVDEEEEANFKQLVRATRAQQTAFKTPAVKGITPSVTRRSSSATAHRAKPHNVPTYQLRQQPHTTVEQTAREKKWIGALTEDSSAADKKDAAAAKHSMHAQYIIRPQSAQALIMRQLIEGFESKVRDVSLMNYLVDTEQFEHVHREHPVRVPPEDLVEDWRSRLHLAVSVPDAPVVEINNTHMSLSEEILRKRRKAGGRKSRDLLEMLFGDVPEEEPREVSSERSPSREASEVFSPTSTHSMRRKSFSGLDPTQLLQREESNARFVNMTKHGVADAKEKILLIVGTFEDLIYQWGSGGASKTGRSSKLGPSNIVLHVPPSMYQLRSEMRSLLLTLGFSEKTVETKSVPSVYNQFLLNDLDTPLTIKEYSAEFNAAIAARMKATANQLVNDVADLYRQNDWQTLSKIRVMTEEEGFTFVDAVTARRPGLMRRASVSVRTMGFSDL